MQKMNFDLKEIGQRLKEARKAVNQTQEGMGELSGFPHSAISEMESGTRRPQAKYLMILTDVFKVNLNWVFTGNGTMFDLGINLDFGKDNQILKEMLYLLDNVPPIRLQIFQYFLELKHSKKELIKEYLAEMNEGKESDR